MFLACDTFQAGNLSSFPSYRKKHDTFQAGNVSSLSCKPSHDTFQAGNLSSFRSYISMTHFRPENAAPHQQIDDMTNDSMLLVTNLLFQNLRDCKHEVPSSHCRSSS